MKVTEGLDSRVFCGNSDKDMKAMELFKQLGYIFVEHQTISSRVPTYYIVRFEENYNANI